jgi:GntR family transcriptional regulator
MSYKAPKYYQIYSDLLEQIKSGDLSEGSKIPSENELIKQYKVSNTTSRKVLQELFNKGYVEKVRGKGTFVINNRVERTASKILSFSKNMELAGLKAKTKLLESTVIKKEIKRTISNQTHILKPPSLKIIRLRFAESSPMMIEERFVSLTLCKGIENMDLETSLYNIYKEKFDIEIFRVIQSLTSIILDEKLFNHHLLRRWIALPQGIAFFFAQTFHCQRRLSR